MHKTHLTLLGWKPYFIIWPEKCWWDWHGTSYIIFGIISALKIYGPFKFKKESAEALNINDGTVCRYADGGICDGW